MNKDRRKMIAAASETIQKIVGMIEDAKSELETARDEEQEYYDNMPESLQSGEKGQAAEAAIEQLETAISELEDAYASIDNAVAAADTAGE